MEQILVIKRVTLDQEGKVQVICEFIANTPESKENLFRLMRIPWNEPIFATFETTQKPLFEDAVVIEKE